MIKIVCTVFLILYIYIYIYYVHLITPKPIQKHCQIHSCCFWVSQVGNIHWKESNAEVDCNIELLGWHVIRIFHMKSIPSVSSREIHSKVRENEQLTPDGQSPKKNIISLPFMAFLGLYCDSIFSIFIPFYARKTRFPNIQLPSADSTQEHS